MRFEPILEASIEQDAERQDQIETHDDEEEYHPQFFNNTLIDSCFSRNSPCQHHTFFSASEPFEVWDQVNARIENIKKHVTRVAVNTISFYYFRPYNGGSAVLYHTLSALNGLKQAIMGLIIIVVSLIQYTLKLMMLCFTHYSWEEVYREFYTLTADLVYNLISSSYGIVCGIGEVVSILTLPVRLVLFLENKFHQWNRTNDEEEYSSSEIQSEHHRPEPPPLPPHSASLNRLSDDPPLSTSSYRPELPIDEPWTRGPAPSLTPLAEEIFEADGPFSFRPPPP